MKKNKIILMALSLICVAFTACNDDYEEFIGDRFTVQPEYFSLQPSASYMGFVAEGGSSENYITAAGADWKITTAADWVKVSPAQGSANSTAFEQNPTSVIFSVDANTQAGDPRVAINMLQSSNSSWSYSTPITVQQNPTTPYINAVGQTDFIVPGEGGDVYLSFETNDNWINWATYFQGTNAWEWMTLEEYKGFGSRNRLKLTIAPNTMGEVRYTTVRIMCASDNSLYAAYSIMQAEAGLNVKEEEVITIDNGASEFSLNINSDLDWTILSSDWLQANPASGKAGQATIKVTALPNNDTNERTGFVLFTIEGYKANGTYWQSGPRITVIQRGLYLSVAGSTSNLDKPIIRLQSTAYTANVDIESNSKWKAEIDPSSNADDWLSLSPASGEGNGTLQLTVKDNPNTIGRSAKVRVYIGNSFATATVSREITVMQNGKSVNLDKSTLYFNDKASTQEVKVIADDKWTASTDYDWITVNPKSGDTNATLSVSVTENKQEGERIGEIGITMSDKTVKLSVVQRGKVIMLSDAPLKFSSVGGKGDIYIATNDTWTAAVEESSNWLSVSPASGKDSAHVAVTVQRNNYPYERQANVVIASGSGKKYTIPVQQAMRYLRASASSFTFLGIGGEQGPLTISSDGTYSLSNSASWLSVTKSEENAYTLTAQPNTEGKQRTDTIVVKCTDLSEGTLELKIPVRQVSDVTDLTLQRYGTDVNWNITSSDGFSVTLTSYSTDQNWNTRGNAPQGISIRHRKQNGTQENKK